MCYFITTTLTAKADVNGVRALKGPEGTRWDEIRNPFVQAQLPADWRYFHLNGGHCDCSSALVRGRHASGRPLRLPQRAKGWSEARRQRWLEQRGEIQEGREVQARGDAQAWLLYLRAVRAAAGSGPVGLMFHFYNAGTENEDVTISRRVDVALSTVHPGLLQILDPDTLYAFS